MPAEPTHDAAAIQKARIRKAVIKGAIMEAPILVAGAFYLLATGLYDNPINIVVLLVVAGAAGIGAGVLSYAKLKSKG